ncbi:RNA polymerase II mediator complex subunit Sin4 [Whalleya microplaca]|nr:RNA polymerase II mediator complex subunit Sin4 [Whalleya microplaca]
MPLILDNPMGGEAMQVDLTDVDDLFGDGAQLSLPPRPPSKRLRQRLDELRSRGCCQGIAWSKGGTIASITPDGHSLQLRYLRASAKDATWSLSEPNTIAPWPNLPGGPIVHLIWGPAASELAIIDAVGRVLILNFNSNLNRPSLTRRWESDPQDDLHAVVGTYWLQTPPAANPRSTLFAPFYAPAVKHPNTNHYNFQMTPIPSTGPWHPHHNKSALICITTNGLLKMFFGQNNSQVHDTSLELDSVTSADDLITHAAVCSDRTKTIFIAMATMSKQLRIVQVGINWNAPKPDNAPSVPPGGHQVSPTLSKRPVASTSWFQSGASESHLDAAMTKISHIEMLPAMHNPAKEWSPMVVLTVRSFIPEPNSHYNQEVQSIIDRWELLADQPQTLHPAFEQLGTRRNSTGSAPPSANRLKKLEPTIVNKIVMGVNVLYFGKVICFTYNDGSVEYRDRFTMAELYREVNLDRIHSILEAGFTQSGEPSCLQMALSPSNFSLAQMYEDGQIKWHSVNYTLADPQSVTDAQVSALVASFTISTAQVASHSGNIDDILAVARSFAHKENFAVDWVKTMMTMMKMTVDYSEDAPHDHLIRNNILQLCLSILNHLGWKGEFKSRSPWGKLSMLAVNLRNIVILISLASNTPNAMKGQTTPLDEPEVVNALAGCVKWSADLLCWLCDSLFCLLDDSQFMSLVKGPQLGQMAAYLQSKNDVALHLIICSATRGLLSAVCRRITLLHTFSTRAITWYESKGADVNSASAPPGARGTSHAALYTSYRKIQRYASSSLVHADEFDTLLTTIGADIRSAYSTSLAALGEQAVRKAAQNPQPPNQNPNAPKPDIAQEAIARGRQHCELGMLVLQAPPPSFAAVLDKFFNKDLREFRAHCDVAKLYFSDFSLLEVDDEPPALAKRRESGLRVDLFKRVPIPRKKKRDAGAADQQQPMHFRGCARCASVMEDHAMMNNKPGLNFLLRQQWNCCCGGRMALLTEEES